MADAPTPTPSTAALLFAAVGVGLVVLLLLAVLMPRLGAEEGWVVPILGGLLAAVVTYLVGAMRKGGRTTNVEPPR